jgi:hypothetical protein
MKRTVYVVQDQHRWDPVKKAFVPKFDLSAAQDHGQLSYLLSPTAAPFNPKPIIAELREKLAGFTSQDRLLLVGNPVLIGFAVAIAAHIGGGDLTLLQWSGKDQRYIEVEARGLFTSSV